MVQKVSERVDNVWLAKLVLHEFHDTTEVGFAHILTVYDFRHENGMVRGWWWLEVRVP